MHKALVIRNKIFDLLKATQFTLPVAEITKGASLSNEFPSISVSLGTDEPLNKSSAFIDWDLVVYTDIYLSSTDDDLDAITQSIRLDIHKSLLTDNTLGLGFVIELDPLGQQQPKHSDDSDMYTSVTRLAWSIKYRTAVADPSL